MKKNTKLLILSLILSFLSILTKIIYPKIYTGEYNLITYSYLDIFLFILFVFMYYYIIEKITRKNVKPLLNFKKIEKAINYKNIIIFVSISSIFGFIFTYTEALTENTNVIWNSILNNSLNNHHPITNTIFLLPGIFVYKITNIYKLGIITNKIVLLIFSVIVYSLLNCYVYYKSKNPKYTIFSLIWTMLLPINFVFSSTVWKDTYFVNFSIIFLIMLYEIIDSDFKALNKLWFIILFMAISIMTCLIRSNAFAPFCLLFFISLIYHKKVTSKYLITMLYIIVIYIGLSKIVLPHFYVYDSSKAETSAIQLSFISRITKDDFIIDSKDKAFLEKIIPSKIIKENYNSNCIDSIKFNSKFNDVLFNNEYQTFKKITQKYIRKYPIEFIKSYLISTYQYWSLYTPDYTAGQLWYIMTKTPIINLITCPIIYLIILTLLAYKYRKNCYILLYIFIFGIYITIYCCAPINISIRYLYIIFPTLVIMLLPLIKKINLTKSKK